MTGSQPTPIATPTSWYREFAPPPALAGHLVCTWTQEIGDGNADYRQHVLPDGCADIIWVGDAAPVIVGPTLQSFVAPLAPRTHIVGARCRPGLVPSLLGLPASELRDATVPLADLWGGAVALALAPPTAATALASAEALLTSRLAMARPVDALVVVAIAWLAQRPAGRIRELCRDLGLSSRQLQRRFIAAVGYGPKSLHGVLRLQRTLVLARRRPAGDGLADLAAAAGYADQAHMSREIRRLAGRAPAALLATAGGALAMSDLFKTTTGPNA